MIIEPLSRVAITDENEMIPAGWLKEAYAAIDALQAKLDAALADGCEAIDALIKERDALDAERAALAKGFEVRFWSDEERDGMSQTFYRAQEQHGHYETLFAVAAFILRHRLALAALGKEPA